jgi:hypothetical protein
MFSVGILTSYVRSRTRQAMGVALSKGLLQVLARTSVGSRRFEGFGGWILRLLADRFLLFVWGDGYGQTDSTRPVLYGSDRRRGRYRFWS